MGAELSMVRVGGYVGSGGGFFELEFWGGLISSRPLRSSFASLACSPPAPHEAWLQHGTSPLVWPAECRTAQLGIAEVACPDPHNNSAGLFLPVHIHSHGHIIITTINITTISRQYHCNHG